MKVCIIGDLKFEKEMNFLKNELESEKHNTTIPIFEYKETNPNLILDINYYNFLREYIFNSDYVLLIEENKNDKSFIFNFGIVFGSKKDFKVIPRNSISNLSVRKLKEHQNGTTPK